MLNKTINCISIIHFFPITLLLVQLSVGIASAQTLRPSSFIEIPPLIEKFRKAAAALDTMQLLKFSVPYEKTVDGTTGNKKPASFFRQYSFGGKKDTCFTWDDFQLEHTQVTVPDEKLYVYLSDAKSLYLLEIEGLVYIGNAFWKCTHQKVAFISFSPGDSLEVQSAHALPEIEKVVLDYLKALKQNDKQAFDRLLLDSTDLANRGLVSLSARILSECKTNSGIAFRYLQEQCEEKGFTWSNLQIDSMKYSPKQARITLTGTSQCNVYDVYINNVHYCGGGYYWLKYPIGIHGTVSVAERDEKRKAAEEFESVKYGYSQEVNELMQKLLLAYIEKDFSLLRQNIYSKSDHIKAIKARGSDAESSKYAIRKRKKAIHKSGKQYRSRKSAIVEACKESLTLFVNPDSTMIIWDYPKVRNDYGEVIAYIWVYAKSFDKYFSSQMVLRRVGADWRIMSFKTFADGTKKLYIIEKFQTYKYVRKLKRK
ncbi:MAG: hypothetical protein KKA07_03520 [Bacteroidetes bacterium]|nr:hypothetical protein [Bacteroidota bacterium]